MTNSQSLEAPLTFQSNCFLDSAGEFRAANTCWDNGRWTSFDVGTDRAVPANGYVVASLPVEFHCHGLGNHDFSDSLFFNLYELNEHLCQEGVICVPTIFLPQGRLGPFIEFMETLAAGKRQGELEYIAGVALEGPLLAASGGTPETGHWRPNEVEWRLLASCGALGLKYMVISPDALGGENGFPGGYADSSLSLVEIIRLLLDGGVRPALGHFQKSDPVSTARLVQQVVDIGASYGSASFAGAVLTDHLFNDTPLVFRHAWRTPDERRQRDRELLEVRLAEWTLDGLDRLAGPVPGLLMRAASEGKITICLNFDGDHVDLEICRKVIELVGPQGIVAMTDGTNARALGGQPIHRVPYNTLYYQEAGVVAAGSSSIDLQIENLHGIGVGEADIWKMISFNPGRILGVEPQESLTGPLMATYVDSSGHRLSLRRLATAGHVGNPGLPR